MKLGVLVLILYVAGVIGFVSNIVKLCKADFEPSYKEEILRGIGIPVAPVGAVLGYIDFEEK